MLKLFLVYLARAIKRFVLSTLVIKFGSSPDIPIYTVLFIEVLGAAGRRVLRPYEKSCVIDIYFWSPLVAVVAVHAAICAERLCFHLFRQSCLQFGTGGDAMCTDCVCVFISYYQGA